MTQIKTLALATMLALGLAACNEDDAATDDATGTVEETEVPIEPAPVTN